MKLEILFHNPDERRLLLQPARHKIHLVPSHLRRFHATKFCLKNNIVSQSLQ